nr:hypothetical protein [uncultured Flavobacterium sp.]
MIYIRIDKKQNITSLMLSNRDIILKNREKQLFINEKNIYENVDDFFISADNEFILFNIIDGCISLKKDLTFTQKASRFFLKVTTNCDNLTFQTDIESNTYLFLNNNKLEKEIELISNYNWEFIFCDHNTFFLYDKIILKAISYPTCKNTWKILLQEYGEIRKILGVKEEKIWVSIYRGGINKDKNILLALDIVSGEVVYQSPSEYDLSDWFIELLSEKNSILSIYGKMSTHQADSPFVEINATTGAVIRNHRIESLYLENLKIGFWKVLDNKIYFTANKDTLHGRHIGILDYNTLEILWQTEISDLRGTFKDFQVSDNKIYALDTGNQLHIFEKE